MRRLVSSVGTVLQIRSCGTACDAIGKAVHVRLDVALRRLEHVSDPAGERGRLRLERHLQEPGFAHVVADAVGPRISSPARVNLT